MVRDVRFDIHATDKSRTAFQSVQRSLGQTRRETQQLSTLLATSSARIVGFGKTFAAAFGAGALVGGLASLPALIRETVAGAAGIADVADKIGVTTERLQELRFAADQSGVAANELDDAMAQFARRIGEASAGQGDLAKILEANNVALRDAQANVRPLNELLAEYANLIKNAGTDQERLSLAVDAFGRSGDGMVNLLRDGASGLEALTMKAREAGAVMSDELVRAAADVDDKFAELQARFETLVKSEIVTFIGDLKTVTSDLAGVGDAAAQSWAKFEEVWNRVAKITPEQAAKAKLRAELIRQAVNGGAPGEDYSSWITFPQAPKGDRLDVAPPRTILPTSPGSSSSSPSSKADAEAAAAARAGQAQVRALTAELQKSQERLQEFGSIGRDVFGGLVNDIRNGVGAMETLGNALNSLTDHLLNKGLDVLFGALFGGGLSPGAAALGKSGLPGLFASGGFVRGPGSGTSDSIPARLSNGEFVVNAAATKRFLPVLERINRFADGGLVSPMGERGAEVYVPSRGSC